MLLAIILSVGAINALIPIMVIIILIGAAAGATRGFSFFNVFGISQLLSGIGSYGGGSRGSMAKTGYPLRAYLDAPVRYKSKYKAKGGRADIEKARKGEIGKRVGEAMALRGKGPGRGPAGGPSPVVMQKKGGGTATRVRLMRWSDTLLRYGAPILWGVKESAKDNARTYNPAKTGGAAAGVPRSFREEATVRGLRSGRANLGDALAQKAGDLKKLQAKYNSGNYTWADRALAFVPLLGKRLDPLRLMGEQQRERSRKSWSEKERINRIKAGVNYEEHRQKKGEALEESNTAVLREALARWNVELEARARRMEEARKAIDQRKSNRMKAKKEDEKIYREAEAAVANARAQIKRGENLLDIAPFMGRHLERRLEKLEEYHGAPTKAEEKAGRTNVMERTAPGTPGAGGAVGELRERLANGEITENQFDREYSRIYNRLYGPPDKNIRNHLTNPYYSGYLLGLKRTSAGFAGYGDMVRDYLEEAGKIGQGGAAPPPGAASPAMIGRRRWWQRKRSP